MGDDSFDIASLIAEEVGEALPAGYDHPLSGILKQIRKRIETAENAFVILGMPVDAESDDLRKAYVELANQLHPDKYNDAPDEMRERATETFDKVREAWDALETDEKRQAHIDHVILGKPTEDELAMEEVKALLDSEASFKKGLAAYNAGRLSAAHKFFEEAVSGAPEELEFCAYKANTTFALNRKTDREKADSALQDLRDTLDANQHQKRRLDGGWVLLGRAYRELGEKDASKRALVQALRFNPSNPDAPRELRRLEGKKSGSKTEDADEKPGFFKKLFGRKKN